MKHRVPAWLRTRLERPPARADATGRREAAVALILATSDAHRSPELLFIKRALVEGDPWSGQMALPGGRREEEDESMLATAVRETAEETGIDLSETALIGELDDLAPQTPVLPPVLVRPFVFAVGDRPDVHPSFEVSDYLWVPIADLPSTITVAEVSVRGSQLTVPAFSIAGEIVWGMTYRIVRSMFDADGLT